MIIEQFALTQLVLDNVLDGLTMSWSFGIILIVSKLTKCWNPDSVLIPRARFGTKL